MKEIKRILITGPTGAVGTALIEEALHNGLEIVAVCRPNSKRLSAIPANPNVRIVECALKDMDHLPELVPDESFDAFFHFAWDGTYGDARQDWTLQESNIRYCVDAVDAAHKMGCKVFVGAGSQSEYGHVTGILNPDMTCDPDNGYGAAKLAAAVMSRARCKTLMMRHEWCRIISLYGPGDGAYTLISQAIEKLLNGEHLRCTKGDQIWDYIYSKDAARAFLAVAENGRDGVIYNFGSGKTRLLREYVEAIRDQIDPSAKIGFGEIDYYPNQVMHLETDIENLKADTGFSPSYTFEEGIKETIEDIKSRCS